jgi:hypothetical protein
MSDLNREMVHKDFLLTPADMSLGEIKPTPEEIDGFDAEDSARKVKSRYQGWKRETEWLLRQILIAYLVLGDKKTENKMTFAEWCKEAGLPNASYAREMINKHLWPEEYEKKKAKDRGSGKKKDVDATLAGAEELIGITEIRSFSQNGNVVEIEFDVLGQTITRKFELPEAE